MASLSLETPETPRGPCTPERSPDVRTPRSQSKVRRGDVSLCVRLKPGQKEPPVVSVEADRVVLKPLENLLSFLEGKSREESDVKVCCDHAFGVKATQEELFDTAVAPIVDGVASGYNGAVIAYGQTGAGKTYSIIGEEGPSRGMAPRAVEAVFARLRQASTVEVSVLEVYNEKVRDLLAASTTTVEVREVREGHGGLSFRCPDANTWTVRTPEEAMAALMEGCRRREVARTDMNDHSSRSHLVFTLNVTQSDSEVGATLRSRLHLVDLAGSERLKRSMVSPRPSRSLSLREAGEINKSLSQLALVIQRLTSGSQYVPYRDSMLTRLLAESFGGSSKTCLLVCCSCRPEDREETKSSLEFGRRAKMVRNKPTINLEVEHEPSAVLKALVAKELQEVHEELSGLREAAAASARQEEARRIRCLELEDELREARRTAAEATEAREKLEMRYSREVEEQRHLLQESAERMVSFLEQAQMDQSSLELAAEALKWQEAHCKAGKRLEEQMLLASGELKDATAAQQALQQQYGREVDLSRQLLELREELVTLQEEKAQVAKRAQEDRSVLLGHWHEEVMRLREEKATALNALQTEKLSLRRHCHEELLEVQRSKDEAIEDLEREKTTLRQKWQKAMEERGVLEAQLAVAEERFQERLRAHSAAVEEEKAVLRRECHEEIGNLLEQKAAEEARQSEERLSLQRRLNDTAAALDQEKVGLLARMEREKATLQSQLQEANKENLRLVDEKATWAEGEALAKAQETWSGAAGELRAAQQLQRSEASTLQSLVHSLSERQKASEWQTSLLQAELAVLQEHLRSKAKTLDEKFEGDVTETEPENEAPCQGSLGKLRSPALWSPSFKDLHLQDPSEELSHRD